MALAQGAPHRGQRRGVSGRPPRKRLRRAAIWLASSWVSLRAKRPPLSAAPAPTPLPDYSSFNQQHTAVPINCYWRCRSNARGLWLGFGRSGPQRPCLGLGRPAPTRCLRALPPASRMRRAPSPRSVSPPRMLRAERTVAARRASGQAATLVRRTPVHVHGGLTPRVDGHLGNWSLKKRLESPQSPPKFRGNSLFARVSLVFATRVG